MFGLGTIINTAAVILGGTLGLLARNGLKPRFQEILMQACGLAVLFIGAAGALAGMLSVGTNGVLSAKGSMLLIFSLVLGGLIGEWINVEKQMDCLGEWLKHLARSTGDNRFVDGFVNTSLIICVGAMAIIGSMQDGLTGDYSMLTVKALLDLIIVMVLASAYGKGAVFAAVPIFFYQGAITLIAHFAGAFISQRLIANLSYVGASLIFCVGVNTVFGKKFRVGNLLPALVIPILYELYLCVF